ncbi:hypothetical protein FSP39_017480 [Pinctada imbricata]|uniref:Uncharacterized protein n=1 Tax=Pinctada imbricata TaxID=66713 RepID=A0AA89BT46_PINIB|nr:hypothetical protein FSP39_017480 [Pinctada imbricata]
MGSVDEVWDRFSRLIKPQYIIFIVLCSIIGYLLRASDSYHLKPVWRKRSEPHHFYNKLNVLTLPEPAPQDEEDKTLPHVEVKVKIILPLTPMEDGGKSRPAAMGTGFTVPYASMMQIRKQIVVVLTTDWQIFCYDNNLELLWQQRLMNISHVEDTYEVKAMGILITSHNVKKNDQGLIIVGGSFTHKVHQVETSTKASETNSTEDDNEGQGNHTTEDNTLTHFSSFALSAKDGSIRWHHLPGDFGEIAPDIKDIHGDHHWKLALKRHRLHTGEAHWTEYKDELAKFLPHQWQRIGDTKLTLGRFQKGEDFLSQDEMRPSRHRSALTPQHIMGYAYGGQRPHSDHEHVESPNAVVIHNHNGVEVLNLLSGRPITELKLPEDKAIYVDFDHDGHFEQINWGQQEQLSPCYVEIWRFHPVKEKIDTLPVCRITRLFFTSSWAYDEDNLKKVNPLVIRSVAKKSGFFRYLLGHHLPTVSQKYDIITFASVGRISSWDKEGNANWQTLTRTGWAKAALDKKRNKEAQKEQFTEFMEEFLPSRTLMSLTVFDRQDVVVYSGWSEITVVSLVDGTELAEHSLPCQPTAPLVTGDFDNDGLNDIIVTCRLGYIGFTIHHRTNHIYTLLYALSVFCAILLLNWICSPQMFRGNYDDDSSDED